MFQPVLVSSMDTIQHQINGLINERLQSMAGAGEDRGPLALKGEKTHSSPKKSTPSFSRKRTRDFIDGPIQYQLEENLTSSEKGPVGEPEENGLDFYDKVVHVLSDSINSSVNLSHAEDKKNVTPVRQRASSLSRTKGEVPLSPASQKFLKEVRDTLENK